MPVYETHAVLQHVDRHTAIVLALCAVALLGNYIFWIENLIVGFRRQVYTMPVPCIFFFVCHDLTYVANYHTWFGRIHHWFPELWWFGLVLTSLMELAFLYQFLRFGRREIAPELSQRAFTAATFVALVGTAIPWLVIRHSMHDPLFLTIFGFTVFWCTPFYLALQWRRKDSVGQSVKGWLAFLLMPLGYWPATWILSRGFHTVLWDSLGLVIILGALANIACIRYLRAHHPADVTARPGRGSSAAQTLVSAR